MSGPLSACVLALKAFTLSNLSQWTGLPPCTVGDVGRAFQIAGDGWRGSGHVGDEHRPLTWVSASGGGFPDSIRVWLDGDAVELMETEVLGQAAEAKALLSRLGAPAARLDAYFSDVLLHRAEWVFPDRGLTLFIEPETGALLRVAAYPRVTLEEYRRRFRFVGGRFVR